MKLSKITLGWGAYIVISAAFMLQVNDYFVHTFGRTIVSDSFKVCFILIFMSTVLYALKVHLGPFKICGLFAIFALAYLFTTRIPLLAEKTHIFTYGPLGYLASKDLIDNKKTALLKNIILVLCFVALVSALDETFQLFLPYRVGEISDFMMDMTSGLFGAAVFFSLKRRLA